MLSTANMDRQQILNLIKHRLEGKVEVFIIIGSFTNKNWNPKISDLDIICLDESFSSYPYLVNIRYLKNIFPDMDVNIDIKAYTWDQFKMFISKNSYLYKNVRKGILYGSMEL